MSRLFDVATGFTAERELARPTGIPHGVIRRGVAPPPRNQRPKRDWSQLREMDVLDFFTFEEEDYFLVRWAATREQNRSVGKKFQVSTCYCACWRIA